jgi:hypothetical protein
VIVTARQESDGSLTHTEGAPAPCPSCGQTPEHLIEVVEIVVESREDLERLAGRGAGPKEPLP